MAVLLVQLQAPDTGLYSIPWTDCTEKPSEGGLKKKKGVEGELKGRRRPHDSITKDKLFPSISICNKIKENLFSFQVSIRKNNNC